MINGQALCPSCNITKGDKTIMSELRRWQVEATQTYFDENKRDFLAVASPGAGKTTWALTLAKSLMDEGAIGRIIVVTYSDALRTQWSDHTDAGVALRPFTGAPVDKPGYDGVVTTYQALAGETGGLMRHAIGLNDARRTLVIMDEIHHAADASAYGQGLITAFEHASRRLMLTGTPWRTDSREKMPFVEFDDEGMLKRDFVYDYGDAVADGVCRRIDFPIVEAQAEWMRDFERKDATLTVERRLRGHDRSDAMRAVLDPSPAGKWLADVITRAHQDLVSIRTEIPDAAGLIVARDKKHARKIARRLKSITGIDAPVVVSAEDEGGSSADAQDAIRRFRSSRDPWIIAVKMIAEGVDIPRLIVGIYATNVSTSMFVTQVIGRFVRVRPNERVISRFYVPPSYQLWAIIREIQRTMPQRLEDEVAAERKREGTAVATRETNYSPLSSESNGLAFTHTHDGDVQGELIGEWSSFLGSRGIPTHYATQAAASGSQPPAAVSVIEKPIPLHRQESALRKEIDTLVGRVAHHCYGDYTAHKSVWRAVWRSYGQGVKTMPITALRDLKSDLEDALASGRPL